MEVRMRRTLLLAGALAAIPIAALAQQSSPPAAPRTPAEFYESRELKMEQSEQLLLGLKQIGDSDRELAATIGYSAALIAFAQELPALFPEGSEAGDARPEIWSDRAGFAAAAARFHAAAEAL